MDMAGKLAELRKRAGWSQEELAARLDVTRQSVSKWESGQSVPDVERIVRMSELFGVTTDYLLKDAAPEGAPVPAAAQNARRVSRSDAEEAMARRRRAAPILAIATFLCIISPAALIVLVAVSEWTALASLTDNAAAGIGLGLLIVLAAAGAAMFLAAGAATRQDEYLEKEPFALDADARAAAEAARGEFAPRKTHLEIAGTVLCILSALPLFAAVGMGLGDLGMTAAVAALLVIAGAGAAVLVYSGSCAGAYERLLEEGDFTRARKAKSGKKNAFSAAYWLIVTAVFLYYTFGPRGNGQPQYSWIVWAIGGVLFGAAMAVWRMAERKE